MVMPLHHDQNVDFFIMFQGPIIYDLNPKITYRQTLKIHNKMRENPMD